MTKERIIQMLNRALELEHAAHIQYLSHAELVAGENAEPIIARLKEIANDELEHQKKFRNLIGLLGGIPSMKAAETHAANTLQEILEQNLRDEKDAIDAYKKILSELRNENGQGYYDYLLEHEVRHILIDEEEHATELELLLDRQGSSY